MWAGMFAIDDSENLRTADEYGVIYATSHQEPMARSSPNEWNKFYPGQVRTLPSGRITLVLADGRPSQEWNFTVNANNLTSYWTEGVDRSKDYDTLYTVGMRGTGDIPLPGANVPRIAAILDAQKTILTSALNGTFEDIPTVFAAYKEVQGYLDQGLVPDPAITLLWTDECVSTLNDC